jgi:hypothetical protein
LTNVRDDFINAVSLIFKCKKEVKIVRRKKPCGRERPYTEVSFAPRRNEECHRESRHRKLLDLKSNTDELKVTTKTSENHGFGLFWLLTNKLNMYKQAEYHRANENLNEAADLLT